LNAKPLHRRHRPTQELVRRLIREYVRPYLGWLALALFFMVLVAGTTAMSAWLMEPVVNEVFVARRLDALWLVGIAILATFCLKGLANYGQATLMSATGLRIVADTQNRLFRHLASMDLAFFHAHSTGGLVSRFVIDIQMMRAAVSDVLTSLGRDVLSLIGLIAILFIQDWELAVISCFVFPLAILPILRLGRRMRKVTANTQQEIGQMTTLLEQTFQGIRVVKSYGMEAHETQRVESLVERVYRLTFRSARIRAASRPIMETLGGIAIALVVVYGGYRVIQAETDPGSFFSFITALLLAYEPMKRLANLNATLQEGLAGAERLFAMLDTPPAMKEKPDARVLKVSEGSIRFESVSFAYGPGKSVLEDLALVVPAGKVAALVGPSGAGKSTALNLIPRFYDVTAGRVLIDGADVRDVTLESLRRNIALVSQEITLFDDTIRANIAYGRKGADDADIAAAARRAGAEAFIAALPKGYDTVVGEQGIKLSGGQRQRLAIARAVLKDAPILLLDEATSALDAESERHVQVALGELMRNRTTLVIAHRLSTVVGADVIYVMDRGRVAEVGTHHELLARSGLYARLYALQSADEPAPASGIRAARA
jgi:ATP-binding cassette, subfamily B, bacterial MsbA